MIFTFFPCIFKYVNPFTMSRNVVRVGAVGAVFKKDHISSRVLEKNRIDILVLDMNQRI